MVTIGTHSGSFHADEALAVYMLKLLPIYKDATVVRSRDNAVLDKCDIVVDVGGKYEPPKYFDHHQREFTTTFSDKHDTTKLSSAGLVYKHFGREVLAQILKVAQDNEVVEAIYDRVYDSFIEPVDAYDNGVNPHDTPARFNTHSTTLRAVVGNLNPLWTEDDSDAAFDAQFVKASEVMGMAFELEVRNQGLSWYPARDLVKKAFEERTKWDPKGRLLVFESYVPWNSHVHDLEKAHDAEIIYVIYKSADSTRVQAVPVFKGSFESRKALPQPWRGLRDEALSEASGIPGGVFVHASGFIGGNKTFDGALELARKGLDFEEA